MSMKSLAKGSAKRNRSSPSSDILHLLQSANGSIWTEQSDVLIGMNEDLCTGESSQGQIRARRCNASYLFHQGIHRFTFTDTKVNKADSEGHEMEDIRQNVRRKYVTASAMRMNVCDIDRKR
jgi:hypothetical protein